MNRDTIKMMGRLMTALDTLEEGNGSTSSVYEEVKEIITDFDYFAFIDLVEEMEEDDKTALLLVLLEMLHNG